jgi:hypothetical protein
VQPISKEALSAADQQIKDNVDLDDLKRRATPLMPDAVQKRLDKINGVGEFATAGAPAMKKAGAKPVAKPAVVSMTDDEDMDDAFPAYNSDAE